MNAVFSAHRGIRNISLLALLCLLATAAPAVGAPCVPGTWADVLGTTCDIGPLTYTFTGFSNTFLLNGEEQKTPSPITLTAADIGFTPTGNAFTLTVSPNQTLREPTGIADAFVQLRYTVVSSGPALTAATLSGGSYHVSSPSCTGPCTITPGASFTAQAISRSQTCAQPECNNSVTEGAFISVLNNTLLNQRTVANPPGFFQILNVQSNDGGPLFSGFGIITLIELISENDGEVMWDPELTLAYTLSTDGGSGGGDHTPPTTVASLSPPPNAAGWNNRNVVVELKAQDEAGGSGVKEIHTALNGAQGGTTTLPGASASVQVSAEGTTTVSYFAVDNAGNQETAKTVSVRIDKTAPSVACVRAPRRGHDDERARHANDDDDANDDGRKLFRVTASDTLSGLAGLTLGDVALTSGETIQIHTTKKPGVRLLADDEDDDDRDEPAVKRFKVGPGEAVILATDVAGNVGRAACPVRSQ